MKFKKIEPETVQCTTSVVRPFGCMELWAGNERAHRSLELAGLEADVIAVPSGADSGGDLSAIFSCSDNVARVVLADCVGHGYVASAVARHIHKLLHKFQDTRDTAGLLASLNNEFTLDAADDDGSLRLTTVVTGTFNAATGEFNFAYAAHPRMLLWRARDEKFHPRFHHRRGIHRTKRQARPRRHDSCLFRRRHRSAISRRSSTQPLRLPRFRPFNPVEAPGPSKTPRLLEILVNRHPRIPWQPRTRRRHHSPHASPHVLSCSAGVSPAFCACATSMCR